MSARIAAKDLQQGQELPSWSYRVVREDLVRYANASGDGNPIHQDEQFAKSVGLPDIIAHGMHTMGRMGQYVTDWSGDPGALERFKTRFSAMVVVPADGGNTVTVTGTVAEKLEGDRVRVDIEATTADGATVAKGEAIVALG
ncbi:MAG TPA: MaoC/PaaZ C-terminal domain-containing protein [Actinomycetota bacterium]|nr:MaoC/PaaZ C-terminal domain-containing protein [Actinomycetota bacterium]